MLQLELFTELPIPSDARSWKRPQWSRGVRPAPVQKAAEQLAFAFRLRTLVCDRDDEFDFPLHAVVDAQSAARAETKAPASVFDFARSFRGGRQRAMKLPPAERRMVAKVEVEQGVTRHVGAAYPSRWTPEDDERERQRRARQRPPRPTKKARTRSRKLLDLVGDNENE